MNKSELIAPAGDLNKLKIALMYGADAVYASTPKFSMRTREIGFDYNSLKEGIEYARNFGKKVYLTLNVFPHSNEIDDLKKHVKKAISLKPDAFIIADPGVIMYVQGQTNIPIHLSTQANTTNQLATAFWAKQGIERVVLARELSIDEIKAISRQSSIPGLEAFVHGSMCMAYSGRCQISNYLTHRDPNRGECVQACRFKYKLYSNGQQAKQATDCEPADRCQNIRHSMTNNLDFALEEETRPGEKFPIVEDQNGTYLLNSKDLCMIEYVDQLIESGVSSFKIEGRLKGAYYVAMVTKAYREAIDLYFDRPNKYTKAKKRLKGDLLKVPNRGYTTGFYLEKPDSETNNYTASKPISNWQYAGFITDYDPKTKRAKIETKHNLAIGDNIEVVSPQSSFGSQIESICLNGEKIGLAHPNQLVEIKIAQAAKRGDFVRLAPN